MFAKHFTVYFRRTIKFDARVANLILYYSNVNTDEVYNQMSHLLSVPNVFVSAIFRLITNCTREITPLESTNCTRSGTCE